MTKTTTNLIGIILTILAGTFLFMKLCNCCNTPMAEEPVKEAVVPVTPDPTSYSSAISDGDYACNVNDNYNFKIKKYGF